MRFKLGKLIKRFTRSLRMILGRQYYMPRSLICRLQPCGYHRSVSGHKRSRTILNYRSILAMKFLLHISNGVLGDSFSLQVLPQEYGLTTGTGKRLMYTSWLWTLLEVYHWPRKKRKPCWTSLHLLLLSDLHLPPGGGGGVVNDLFSYHWSYFAHSVQERYSEN